MPATLLLSDLHLPAAPSHLRETFSAFLAGPARSAAAVYILGDLFEWWIGDDPGLVEHAREVRELRALTDAGVPVSLMHGNRDFLIGPGFAAASGVRLIADPLRLELDGVPTLLSHGDRFCTDDRAYQRWRRFAHSGLAQAVFLHLPVPLRRRIAGVARERSTQEQRAKPAAIMDVSPAAVRAAFAGHDVARIIHGHTHRPAEHVETVNGRRCERIVLADWRDERCEYLRCEAGEIERVAL